MTIKDDIEKARILRRQLRPQRTYKADGLRAKEVSTSSQVIYCPHCKGPVVDSERARSVHAQRMPACRAAILGGQ